MTRPNFLVAKTIADANQFKGRFPQCCSWHVMTPRNHSESGYVIGQYLWTPSAKDLPPQVRWDLRMRLGPCIDEDSKEWTFRIPPAGW